MLAFTTIFAGLYTAFDEVEPVKALTVVDNTTDDTDINDGTSTKSSADDDDVENDQQATTVAHQQQCTAVEVVAQQSEMKF